MSKSRRLLARGARRRHHFAFVCRRAATTPKRVGDREFSFVHVEILSRATAFMRKIVKAPFRHLDAAEVHLSGDECGSADDVVVNPLSGAVGSTWAESEVIHRKGATDPGPALVR